MHQSLRFLATSLIAAALLGCASTSDTGYAASSAAIRPKTAALPGRPACFRVADFGGSRMWIALNDSELIVADPVFSRSYLIELSQPVYDLKHRRSLQFEPFTPANGCICDGLNDYLLAVHSGLGGHVPIVAVRELTVPQERRLLLKFHVNPTQELPAKGFGHQVNGCPTP